MEQAGLRKVRVREQIASVSEPWDGQWNITKIWNCFIECTKQFDCMQDLRMRKCLRSVRTTNHLMVLIE
jgi:hypothetical protein